MSDQRETTSDIGSDGRPQQHQQNQIHVEGMETMRVRVTNIVDGVFRFASKSASDLSASRGEMSESGRSSVGSTRQQQSSISASSNPNNQLMPSASNGYANTSKRRNRNVGTADENSTNRKSLQRRSFSTKKVKFKEHPNAKAAATASTSMSSLFTTSFAALSAVGGGVGVDDSRRSLINDDSQLSGNDNIDASASSNASWNVHLLPERGEESGAEFRNRNSLSLSPPTSKTTTIAHNSSIGDDDDEYDGSDRSGKGSAIPPWFEKYMPSSINRLRAFCGRIVLDDRFQIFMIILIMANALFMGLATFDFIDENPRIDQIFELIDDTFLIIFTVELALQFGYWGYQLFFDGWLLFDFVTIVSSWLLEGVQVFRSFRIFRAFRLVVRIPILKSLVYAVLHVLPRISSIMGLFSLIIYIFAVMTTTLFKDYYEMGITDENYFGRLDYSLFTLFQFVTLENWSAVVRQIAAVDYFAYFIFGTFLTISAFILYSLVVAVVCDSFLMVESKIRKEIKDKARMKKESRKSLKQLKKMKRGRNVDDVKIEGIGDDDDDDEDIGNPKTQTENSLRRDKEDVSPKLNTPLARAPMADASSRNSFIRTPSPPAGQGKSLASSPSPTSTFKPKQPSPPPARKASLKEPEKQQKLLRKPTPNAEVKNDERAREQSDEEKLEQDDDCRLDPLNVTETTSPTATTTTRTLAFGELERKKRSRKKKKRTAKQRIRRVQMRLERLAKTQADILFRLDQMCKEVEEFNDGAERR